MVSTGMDVEARCGAPSCRRVPLTAQEEAVRGLIGRILPEYRHLFRVHGIRDCGHDHHAAACFEVSVSAGLIHIYGTSGKGRFSLHCANEQPTAVKSIVSHTGQCLILYFMAKKLWQC